MDLYNWIMEIHKKYNGDPELWGFVTFGTP